MKIEEHKVGDVKCVDDGDGTKGVLIGCEGYNYVSLIFDSGIPHEQTDELARTLRNMKLVKVEVQNGH